jgi:hypothetical protein
MQVTVPLKFISIDIIISVHNFMHNKDKYSRDSKSRIFMNPLQELDEVHSQWESLFICQSTYNNFFWPLLILVKSRIHSKVETLIEQIP